MSYDTEKITCLRKQIYSARKKLGLEYAPKVRKRMQLEIRILEIRVMIEMSK
jgi:hypothetical protein